MNIRHTTSLFAMLCFLLMLLTSIVLYIVPHGRVAYWVGWRLWGLSKEQWAAIHINSGLFFLLALCLHIYYNWHAVVSYLKGKNRRIKVFTREFNAALVLAVAVAAGTYAGLPPFSQVIMASDAIKKAASQRLGEPPYGHAELSSLATLSKRMQIDLQSAVKELKDAGYHFEGPSQSLREIAWANNVSPQEVYSVIKPE